MRFVERPWRIVWRCVLLRRLPVGWWELLDTATPEPAQRLRRPSWLVPAVILSSVLAMTTQTFLVQHSSTTFSEDPRKNGAEVAPIGGFLAEFRFPVPVPQRTLTTVVPGTSTAPASVFIEQTTRLVPDLGFGWGGSVGFLGFALILYGGMLWLALRYVCFPLLLNRRTDPATETRRPAGHAADLMGWMFPANVLWLSIIAVGSITLARAANDPRWTAEIYKIAAITSLCAVIGFAPVIWYRNLSADQAGRIFRRGASALVLVAAWGSAPAVIVAAVLRLAFWLG